MRKILEAQVNDIVRDIRDNETYVVLAIDNLVLENKTNKSKWNVSEDEMPTIKRWFKIVGQEEPQVQPQPLTQITSVDNISNVEQLLFNLTEIAYQKGCTTKQNSDHLAIKYNNKNIMALRHTKKAVHMTFRQSILDEVMVQYIADNYQGKLVGNGQWALNYRASNIDTMIFEDILSIAISKSR